MIEKIRKCFSNLFTISHGLDVDSLIESINNGEEELDFIPMDKSKIFRGLLISSNQIDEYVEWEYELLHSSMLVRYWLELALARFNYDNSVDSDMVLKLIKKAALDSISGSKTRTIYTDQMLEYEAVISTDVDEILKSIANFINRFKEFMIVYPDSSGSAWPGILYQDGDLNIVLYKISWRTQKAGNHYKGLGVYLRENPYWVI